MRVRLSRAGQDGPEVVDGPGFHLPHQRMDGGLVGQVQRMQADAVRYPVEALQGAASKGHVHRLVPFDQQPHHLGPDEAGTTDHQHRPAVTSGSNNKAASIPHRWGHHPAPGELVGAVSGGARRVGSAAAYGEW